MTHFENDAVVVENETIREEKKPLVIKPPASHHEHWLQRRLKMFRPDMVDTKPPETFDPSTVPDRIGDGEVKSGLQIIKRSPSPEEATDEQPSTTEMQVDELPKTEDDLARELLIAQAADPNYTGLPAQQKLVIPPREPLTEEDVYAYDMAHLSDAPTLEAYKRVPVEAFGMGILLGLGWKEGTDLNGKKMKRFKEPKKRPDFLGIGAKDEAFLRLDDKGRTISRKDQLGGSWNPLKKVDKATGEVIVEAKGSRIGSPKDQSGLSTPRKEGSRYGTPSGGHSGYDSGRERDQDRDRDRRRDDDRSDRRYDSDRESKRKDRDYDSDRKYDSDYDRKRRRDRGGERSANRSHRGSRRPSPTRSRSPRKDR